MLRSLNFTFLFSIVLFLTLLPPKGNSSEDDPYEITYDQLIDKIRSRQKNYTQKRALTAWDQVSIYPSFSFIQSMIQINSIEKQNYFQNGMQIGIGMELFSTSWFAETTYRNFGVTKSNSYELTLKELDFKVGYKNLITNSIDFRASVGVSTRHFRLTNEEIGFHDESKNPALISALGMFSHIQDAPLILGLEANYRSLLVSSLSDKGSLGLDLIIMGYF